MASGPQDGRVYRFADGWVATVMPNGTIKGKKEMATGRREKSDGGWHIFDGLNAYIADMDFPDIPWMPRKEGLVIDITAEVVEDGRKTTQETPLLIEGPSTKKRRKRNRSSKGDGV